jgi:hypothetical protein
MSGVNPFVIDQTVSVLFQGQSKPWLPALLASAGETLAAHGGTPGSCTIRPRRRCATWSAPTP